MQIRTERLLLRRPIPADLEAFFEITSNPSAMRYWSTLPHADLETTRGWLEGMIARADTGGEHFAIALDGRVIGEVFPTSHFVTISRGTFAKALEFGDLNGSFLPMLALVPVIVMVGAAFVRKQEK